MFRLVVSVSSLLFFAGCATKASVQLENADVTGLDHEPMIALEAWRHDERFFVRYRQGEQVRYSGGAWGDVAEPADGDAAAHYAAPALAPLEYHRLVPGDALPGDAVSLPILDVAQWRRLRDRMLRTAVPAAGAGLVIDFGRAEYFLYHDDQGVFQVSRLLDKPADYRVQEVVPFDDFIRRGRPVLEAFLVEQGITQREFVFNTGDVGPYSLPFIYVNTEHKRLAFVRNVPPGIAASTIFPGLRGGQALTHMLHSHLAGLAVRPVSSLYRLFFLVTDTTVSTLSFDWATGLIGKPVPAVVESAPMDLESWELELDRISGRPESKGSVEFLVDGEAYFSRLIDSITAAEESVHLQTYIFDNDDYAVKVAELLKRRSNEGVEVKVLLDGLGTIAGTMADSESLPEEHEPPASVRVFLQRDSEVKVRQKANPWFTGDHVKATIVDERIAFVGGMNIGREYRYDWHDLMLEVRGPLVDEIRREFHLAWGRAGPLGDLGYVIAQMTPTRRVADDEGHPLRILLTGAGNYEIYAAQLEAIRRAQSYIYIQNAYLTDDRVLRELVLARRRGVDVRVIIPLETDHGPISRSNVLAMNLMLEHGIRVFIYPGFSHVKAAIYDGWVCVGSANFDRLSLKLNRELNVASSDPAVARQLLERLFEPDFAVSPELIEPVPQQWLDHLVEVVGDYLY